MPEERRSKRPTRHSKRNNRPTQEVPDVSEVLEEPHTGSAAQAATVEVASVIPDGEKRTRRRRRFTREEMEEQFDSYNTLLEEQLTATRNEKNRKVSVRTWRNLMKEQKKLKANALRAMKKTKVRDKDEEASASGFMKPVKVSTAMSNFAGWPAEEMKSRVDVTKFICEYIKNNNLQNPEDRRQILADDKLKTLLDYDREKDGEPLTYYYLQRKIQPHFTK